MEMIWAAGQGQQWMDHILQERRRGCRLLVLAQDPAGTVWGVGRDLGTTEDAWWGIDPEGGVVRPSSAGVGEWIHQQEELAHQSVPVRWDPPEHPRRTARGKGIFRYPLGPVHADVSESLRYDLSVMGDEIVYLALRHGYKPRHIAALCASKPVDDALALVERTTATSSFSHQWAFAMAVEQARGQRAPEAVRVYRSVAQEMERLASHLGDLATLASSTGLPVAQMDYLHLKETILRWNFRLFHDRYLRGALIRGALDPAADAAAGALIAVGEQARSITRELLHTPSFLDRLVGAGKIPAGTLDFVRPVGPVGRSAGLGDDVRALWDYGVYDAVSFAVPQWPNADAYSRFMVRTEEVSSSVNIIRRLLPVAPRTPPIWPAAEFSGPGRGIGVVEAPRGLLAYAVWLTSDGRQIEKLAVATPSARNWHVVPPAVANNNILQDFPIIDASFLLSVAGWDQ